MIDHAGGPAFRAATTPLRLRRGQTRPARHLVAQTSRALIWSVTVRPSSRWRRSQIGFAH
jgi:hypothetical protein